MQSLQHRQTWDLIPWLVNNTASPVERALAEAHLAVCADCRDEYAFQTRVSAGLAIDAVIDAPLQPALDRMLARIDIEDAGTATSPRAQANRSARMLRFLAAAVVVQAIGLAGMGGWLLQRDHLSGDARYRTLSTPATDSPSATVRFVPSPELSVGQLQRLLSDNGLRVASANEAGTIFALAPVASPSATSTDEAIAHLRATTGVLLAEPIARSTDAR